MFRNHIYVFALFVSLASVSCSTPKTISRNDLRSNLLTAISLASETELFIGQLQRGRIAPVFAEGHLAYLGKEVSRLADELCQARADEATAAALETLRSQLDSLGSTLSDLKEKSGDRERLSVGRQQTVGIRMMLAQAKDEL
jgi:hypothetical protein